MMTNEAALDRVVARLNIERFRKKLTEENDETRRQILLELVAEETAKLFEPMVKHKITR